MGGRIYLFLGLLSLLAFLPLLPYINYLSSVKYMRCIFCDIVNGKRPETHIEFQTQEFVIFKDISPASTHHYLAVPKRHIDSLKSMTKDDLGLVNNMEAGLKEFFISKRIDLNDALFGFHLPPFISVNHLHLHGIAPKSNMSFTNNLIFKTGTPWFKTPEEARNYIKARS